MNEDKDKLRVNSIERFSKKSSRLLLEEHGACEVPAGCGGVVLRWINAHQARPLLIWIYASVTLEMWINGLPPASGRPLLPPGRTVLAFHLTRPEQSAPALFLAGLDDPKDASECQPLPLVVSADDRSWRYVDVEPNDDAWLKPGFDDSVWKVLRKVSLPEPNWEDDGWNRFNKLRQTPAQAIGPEQNVREIWVRKEFELPPIMPRHEP